MESVSRYDEVIKKSDKVHEEVLQYLKEREEKREINEKLLNIALNYRLTKELQPSKEEELLIEVEKLKVEIKNLRSIVDELGYMVVNHPLFLAQEDTETLIRKSQNTLKILDKLCQV